MNDDDGENGATDCVTVNFKLDTVIPSPNVEATATINLSPFINPELSYNVIDD